MNDEQLKEIARACAKAKPQSYYAEPFEPHEWVIDALRAVADGGKGEAVADLLTDYIELNMSNYDEDDVSRLNEWAIRAYGVLAAPQAECAPREAQPVSISDDHAHALYKLAHQTGFVGWLNEFRKSLAAPTPERAPPPYSAPFTTDVPQCCGDPETCDDPCTPEHENDGLTDDERKDAEYFRGIMERAQESAGVGLIEDELIIPADLLTEMIDDIQDYASSTTFKDREVKWRDTLLKRARAVIAAEKEPQP